MSELQNDASGKIKPKQAHSIEMDKAKLNICRWTIGSCLAGILILTVSSFFFQSAQIANTIEIFKAIVFIAIGYVVGTTFK